jgi:hypothetical protein
MVTLTAAGVGYAAYHALTQAQLANVIGVTSRGVFMRVANDRVIFVSFESYRGPLTITFDPPSMPLKNLAMGETVEVWPGRLIFPTIEVAIAIGPDAIWRYPDATMPARSIDEQLKTIRRIAQKVLARRGDQGFGAWLAPLLGLSSESASRPRSTQSRPFDRLTPYPPCIGGGVPGGASPSQADLLLLRQALAANDLALTFDLINRLLGFGRGLTPSGDDCVMGLLLMLNRWRRVNDWSELNRSVMDATYQRTTTISANLIECAADGQGDERLMKVVDGVVTGTPSVDECVDYVLAWGSSSGMDALVGMALAVTARN